MIKKEIVVEKDKKLVTLLSDFGFSFAQINKMLSKKDVKVDKKAVKENIMVYAGSVLTVFHADDALQNKFETLFEDEEVMVIYKHSGIEVEGEAGLEGVLKNAIAVHRLDRNTEGVMIFAKTKHAEEVLKNAFKERLVTKIYVAEVEGCLNVQNKHFKAFLKKDSQNSIVKIFDKQEKGSLDIEMIVTALKSTNQSSLLEIKLLTGRTHQIRAHLAHLGHAILGDGKYGQKETNKKFKLARQRLACIKLKFGFHGVAGIDNKTFEKKPTWFVK